MSEVTLVALARDALNAAGRYQELLAALDTVPSVAAVCDARGRMLLHNIVGRTHFESVSYPEHGLTRWGILDAVFKAHPDALHACDSDGMLPIHHAAVHGSRLATQYLIEQSEVSAKDSHAHSWLNNHARHRPPEQVRDAAGMLPVHLALEHRAPTQVILDLLHAHGGWMADHNGNEEDGHGWELIHLACAFKASRGVLDHLLDDGRWESALMALNPINCDRDCPRCTDVSPAVRASHTTLPWQIPARIPARPDECVHALPLHLAARCGARLSVVKALARACENIENCTYMRDGHVIDAYGYLPSDYAIAQGAPSTVVEELFGLEAAVLPDAANEFVDGEIDRVRRRAFAVREPERRRRRGAEPGGMRSSKRPCV